MDSETSFACFGDSIVSNQVSGMGTAICRLLGFKLNGNYACGYATGADHSENGINITPELPEESPNEYIPRNVLSNQIKRCLKENAARRENVDIAYIAIGINDGKTAATKVINDADRVARTPYEELDRTSYAGALTWAVLTLKKAYPGIKVFLASPMFTARSTEHMLVPAVLEKRSIVMSVCENTGAFFVDNTYLSFFTPEYLATCADEVHPCPEDRDKIAEIVAGVIRKELEK